MLDAPLCDIVASLPAGKTLCDAHPQAFAAPAPVATVTVPSPAPSGFVTQPTVTSSAVSGPTLTFSLDISLPRIPSPTLPVPSVAPSCPSSLSPARGSPVLAASLSPMDLVSSDPPSAVMRRRCGSMCGNAQSDDLEPGARRRGVAARQASGVATRMPQPQPHTLNSTHTHLASIARPRHLIRSPSNSARVLSICGTTHPQRIRAQRRPDPPQSHQNCLRQFQGSQGAHRHFRLKQTMPPTRLSVPKSPLSRRTTPNVARHVTRPKSKYIEIGRQWPIS